MATMKRITWYFFALIFGLLSTSEAMNVAVIGAGAAGLASAKNALDLKYDVDVFEKNDNLGGVWYYTDKSGDKEYGINIYSPMYKELR